MKCGTSSLHQYLSLHPEIFMSRIKELNFFVEDATASKGLDWYRRQLRGPGRICGESSPNYMKYPHFPGVPKRIEAALGAAKLLVVCRDPIRRAISHFVHNVWDGRERRSFTEALADLGESNIYITTSRYDFQLQQFRRHFADECFYLIEFEQLANSPRAVLRGVFEFLGVDPDFDHPDFDKVHHASSVKGKPPGWMSNMSRWPAGKALRSLIGPLFESEIEKPVPSDSQRERLESVLGPDVARLRAWSGQSFSSWSI